MTGALDPSPVGRRTRRRSRYRFQRLAIGLIFIIVLAAFFLLIGWLFLHVSFETLTKE